MEWPSDDTFTFEMFLCNPQVGRLHLTEIVSKNVILGIKNHFLPFFVLHFRQKQM